VHSKNVVLTVLLVELGLLQRVFTRQHLLRTDILTQIHLYHRQLPQQVQPSTQVSGQNHSPGSVASNKLETWVSVALRQYSELRLT
jgi:hypothetical protein